MELRLPEFAEPVLAALPRPALRWLETHASPFGWRSQEQGSAGRPRVALVKSEITGHIFSRPGLASDLPSLVLSTWKMTGPTALFTQWNAEFLLVRLSPDAECQHWRESFAHDPDPGASARSYDKNRTETPPGVPSEVLPQGASAVPAESVDWSRYDAVFSHDLAVPERIVRNHPRVFWSYWIGETGTPTFKRSYRQPLAGYHCFLNGGSRRWRVRPGLRPHALEFPYIFQHPRDREHLGAESIENRRGIFLEKQTSDLLPDEVRRELERLQPVLGSSPLASERLRRLHTSRYYIQMGGQTVWGNGMQEAVMAGCLALVSPATMPNNLSLLLPDTSPRSWSSLVAMVRRLEGEEGLREKLRQRQESLAGWLLFHRPARDWLGVWRRFRARGL